MKKHLRKNVTRRDVLRYTLAGAGMAALGPLGNGLLRSAEGAPIANHKRMVVVFGYGGFDGLSMTVPVHSTAYYNRRPTIAIGPNDPDSLALGGTNDYRFHGNMTRMRDMYNATDSELAIIRKVGYEDENLSHFTSQDVHSWAVRHGFGGLGIDPSGWIARTADQMGLSGTGAVAVGVGRPLEVEGAKTTNPLLVSSLGGFQFNADQTYPQNHALRMEKIKNVLDGFAGENLDSEAATAISQGHELADQIQQADENYSSSHEGEYPDRNIGNYLKDIAKLIQAGFDSQIFFTGLGGWDNHGNLANAMPPLIDRLDKALGAFRNDCTEMGVWDDTVVVVASEFGRRNFENGSAGDDHGHGNTLYALGGNVNGGMFGDDITDSEIGSLNWLGYTTDFRDIYREILTDHLGTDGNAIFPEPQEFSNNLGLI